MLVYLIKDCFKNCPFRDINKYGALPLSDGRGEELFTCAMNQGPQNNMYCNIPLKIRVNKNTKPIYKM